MLSFVEKEMKAISGYKVTFCTYDNYICVQKKRFCYRQDVLCIALRISWLDITVLNARAPIEGKYFESKEGLYDRAGFRPGS